jgi:hypothetical protein
MTIKLQGGASYKGNAQTISTNKPMVEKTQFMLLHELLSWASDAGKYQVYAPA